jgi:hypothetical protein
VFSEHVSVAIKREFVEEAMNSNPDGAKHVDKLFKAAVSVKKFSFIDYLYSLKFE